MHEIGVALWICVTFHCARFEDSSEHEVATVSTSHRRGTPANFRQPNSRDQFSSSFLQSVMKISRISKTKTPFFLQFTLIYWFTSEYCNFIGCPYLYRIRPFHTCLSFCILYITIQKYNHKSFMN